VFCSENRPTRIQFHPWFQMILRMKTTPRPSIAKYGLRNDMKRSRFGTMVSSPDTNESFCFVFIVFGVFDDDIPITIFVETFCVEDFEFWDFTTASETLLCESPVGVFALRILVEIFHVRMSGSRILCSVDSDGGVIQDRSTFL